MRVSEGFFVLVGYRKKGGLNFFVIHNASRAQLSYQTRTTSIYILDTVNGLNI